VVAAAPALRRGPADVAHRAEVKGASYAFQGASLTTAGGDAVGGFLVIRAEEPAPVGFAGVRRSLLVAGALGFLLALVVAWSAARRITRPARALAAAATRALDGEYARAAREAFAATQGAPRDEVAALGRALTTLLDELRDKQALVATLAPASPAGDEARVDGARIPGLYAELPRRGIGAVSGPGTIAARRAGLPLPTAAGGMTAGSVVAERYALQQQVGSGGIGVVYRAVDLTLNETIALKALRPDLLDDDPRLREGLKHELRLTRRVSHRNVVRTHDFGSSEGVPFITMEYVAGESLGAILQRHGPLPPPAVVAIAKQLFRALEAAHEQGVVHGDLKPANVLLAGDGLLKVTDFGLASLVRRPRTTSEPPVAPPRLAGAVVGTPEYMAPELLLGAPPDVRTDLYAAGVLLHECLTGTTPFPQDTPRAFLAHKLDAPAPELPDRRVPWAPPRLQQLLAQLTAREPAARPPSAAAVSASLTQLD
ncbi:MAG TPA: serine/threonine-protein kinase, partial [Gemmatimonadaceae bacterium]